MIRLLAMLAGVSSAQTYAPVPVPLAPIPASLAAARPVLPVPGLAPIGLLPVTPMPSMALSLESDVHAGAVDFDGARAQGIGALASPLSARTSKRWPGWTQGRFESPVDGAPINFRWRLAERASDRPVRVFVGGMALADSFDPYLEKTPAGSPQYVLVPRGLPPTPWTNAAPLLDADAWDLARMIVVAAREQKSQAVELVLHSYSAFAFQRMLQLAADPEIAAAVALVRAGRVIWIGGTTHWKGSEASLGREFEMATHNARMLTAWIDSMDHHGRSLDKMAEMNPFFAPQAAAWNLAWGAQRAALLEAASGPSRRLLAEHLDTGWDPGLKPTRKRMLAELAKDSHEPGWGEASLRRMTGALDLEFTDADLARIRAWGIRLDMIYGRDDQFIPWEVEREVLARFGINAPKELPTAGTVLRDASGLITVRIAEGDHYLPVKRPGAFAGEVDP